MEKVLRERIAEAKKCVEEAIYMLYKLSNDLSSPMYTSKDQILRDMALRLSVALTKLRDCYRILKEIVFTK
jgi:hypothetical protein